MDQLIAVARQTLVMVDTEPPPDEAELLTTLTAWLGQDNGGVHRLFARLREGKLAEEPVAELAALAELIEALCERVDRLVF